jgi:xylulose-5-phosphate/fructose-6-phosphate phosphoketolase
MTSKTERLQALDSYWRAANYLSAGQIYLRDNPLLRRPLTSDDIKPRLLGHWGTDPGLNLIYAHLDRLIQDTDAEMIYVAGPGHGGPALRANVYLEGTMTEIYPHLSMDSDGAMRLLREFSWPGGAPSHVSPPTPGSIHEGGELGYALAHAFGAAFDNPDLIVACVVGDGEAETGPAAGGWQSNKFLNPARDGAVLPVLHLNGYKIAGPTLFGRMSDEQVEHYFRGCGYEPRFVEGSEPEAVHRLLWDTIDWAYAEIRRIQDEARKNGVDAPPVWPLIVLRTPKGWTGPKVVDGLKVEGTFRSHQVPLADVIDNPEHLRLLEQWLRSYRPEDLFDEAGHPVEQVLSIVPRVERRMGASPYANGGLLLKDLALPDYARYAVDVPAPGGVDAESTRELGKYLRDIFVLNRDSRNFRLVCPDETSSNRLDHVFEVTGRTYLGKVLDSDSHLSADGRVMEVLSEHLCEGWLEAYLLTGRHGLFPCYEAFCQIVDSMAGQHAKWLKMCAELPWRKPVASLNYLLTSHAWRQDHNGYSHQGPGFIEMLLEKKSSVVRIYLPPDTNCLLSVADHCLRSRNYVNLIIAGKQPAPQWLDMPSAKEHCARGASIWEWASNDASQPDVVFAAAGDTPTLEMMGAVWLLRQALPELRLRVVNVVDLFTLIPHSDHPHGFDEQSFIELFTESAPVVFAFHGYPRVIHELTYRRPNGDRFHVRGYIEEGTTTTPFDMTVLNKMSRYHLAIEALHRTSRVQSRAGEIIGAFQQKLAQHEVYIREHGEDMPEIRNWRWTAPSDGHRKGARPTRRAVAARGAKR